MASIQYLAASKMRQQWQSASISGSENNGAQQQPPRCAAPRQRRMARSRANNIRHDAAPLAREISAAGEVNAHRFTGGLPHAYVARAADGSA